MGITSAYPDTEYFAVNGVTQGGGTGSAYITIPTETTSVTDCFIVGTSAGAESFYQKLTCTVNVDNSGNTSFAAVVLGNSNPKSDASLDMTSDSIFNGTLTHSSAELSVSSGGVLTCTVTNNSNSQDNDFLVVFDSIWVKNT